jgi:hypothetical protein
VFVRMGPSVYVMPWYGGDSVKQAAKRSGIMGALMFIGFSVMNPANMPTYGLYAAGGLAVFTGFAALQALQPNPLLAAAQELEKYRRYFAHAEQACD